MGSVELGQRLKKVRELRRLSLARVGTEAGVSAAYLQKLERGDVQSPSPHHLHGLALVLKIPYGELMQLAGYVVPRSKAPEPGVEVLAQALQSEKLTQDELDALAEYLQFYRKQRAARP